MLVRRVLAAIGVASVAISCRVGYDPIDLDSRRVVEAGAGRPMVTTGGAGAEPSSAGGRLGSVENAGAGGGATIGGSGPVPGTCSTGAILCEPFDGTTALTLAEIGGKLSFVTNDPWQGTASLGCTATPSAGARVEGKIPGKTGGEVHARARFKIDSGAQVAASGFATLLAVHATINDKLSLDLRAGDLVGLVTPSGVVQSSQPVPRDRWFCAELSALVASDSSGWARVSIDGAVVAEISAVPTLLPEQAYGELWAGIEWFSEGSAPLGLQLDDLQYSELPLPCP